MLQFATLLAGWTNYVLIWITFCVRELWAANKLRGSEGGCSSQTLNSSAELERGASSLWVIFLRVVVWDCNPKIACFCVCSPPSWSRTYQEKFVRLIPIAPSSLPMLWKGQRCLALRNWRRFLLPKGGAILFCAGWRFSQESPWRVTQKQIIFEAETLGSVYALGSSVWEQEMHHVCGQSGNNILIVAWLVRQQCRRFSCKKVCRDGSVRPCFHLASQSSFKLQFSRCSLQRRCQWSLATRCNGCFCRSRKADGNTCVAVTEIGEDGLRRIPSFKKDESVCCGLNMVCRRSFLSLVTIFSECKCSAPVLQMFAQVEG